MVRPLSQAPLSEALIGESTISESSVSESSRPALDDVWCWLDEVLDPEVPALSVVDLGVVRDVNYDAGELVVSVTPTYSGCPATRVIEASIESTLRAKGIERVRVRRVLAPAWTSDWITTRGREQLLAYGIVPPQTAVSTVASSAVDDERNVLASITFPWSRPQPQLQCPRCASARTELLSAFGSTACKAQYRCTDCLEPFEYFKCI
jgi:ring-1,2-phenylacetyl-CoA epoxidase subunit PaaD